MKAHFEAAGHAREGQGRCQVSTTQTDAIGVEVPALFGVGFFEPKCLVCFAVVHKLSRDDAARAQHFAVRFERFVHHRKAVALAQRAVKVDVTRKDVR